MKNLEGIVKVDPRNIKDPRVITMRYGVADVGSDYCEGAGSDYGGGCDRGGGCDSCNSSGD